jgi:hypothetical protein
VLAGAERPPTAEQLAHAIRRVGDLGPRRWLWGRRRVARCLGRLVDHGLATGAGDADPRRFAATSKGRAAAIDGLAALELSDFMPEHLAADREHDRHGPLAQQNRRRGL